MGSSVVVGGGGGGGETSKKKAMWLYPKVMGFTPSERWGHSACYYQGNVYVFGVCSLFSLLKNFQFFGLLLFCFLFLRLFSFAVVWKSATELSVISVVV